MKSLIIDLKRGLAGFLAALMALPCTIVIGAGVFGAATIATAPEADAQRGRSRTVARSGPAGTTVRHHSVNRGVVAGPASTRGTARRTSRRVTRRRMYTLPAGYRVVNRGAYRYYYYSGVYYYPYYISGQTVYVEVDVDVNGNPESPPPASEVNVSVSSG